ncbi:MAG: hypothetical protein ACIAQU_04195 [Phycisphaerales bacterium JB064]
MAGDWIKIEHATPDKEEIDHMAEQLGITVNEVIGGLVRLWIWADQQTIDGNARIVTKSALDRHAGVSGLADAMLHDEVRWLSPAESGGYRFVNFDRHNTQTSKTRALTAKRVSKHRNDAIVTSALAREEKRREEKKKDPPTPQGGPDRVSKRSKFDYSPEFEAAWSAYGKDRGEKAKAFNEYKLAIREIRKKADAPSDAHAWLLDRIRAFQASKADTERRFVPHMENWLKGGGFDTDLTNGSAKAEAEALYARRNGQADHRGPLRRDSP